MSYITSLHPTGTTPAEAEAQEIEALVSATAALTQTLIQSNPTIFPFLNPRYIGA